MEIWSVTNCIEELFASLYFQVGSYWDDQVDRKSTAVQSCKQMMATVLLLWRIFTWGHASHSQTKLCVCSVLSMFFEERFWELCTHLLICITKADPECY